MNRETLKTNYLNQLKGDKYEKFNQGYDAHHLANLSDKLIDHDVNCIMLKEGHDDLIDDKTYKQWLENQVKSQDLTLITDVDKIREILNPIKKILKNLSEDRNKEEIIAKLSQGQKK